MTTRSPWPATRGDSMRMGGFMRALAPRHDIVCCVPRLSAEAAGELRAWGVEPVRAELRSSRRAWPGRLPFQVAPGALWRVPRSTVESSDVLHVSTVRSAPMLERRDWPRAHLDFVDALSRNTLHRATASHLRPFWRNEAERLRRFEIELASRVASSSCTTDEDRRAIGIPTIRVIPFGVEVPASVPPPAPAPTILFPGNLGYFANIDAAVWLAEELLPLVREAVSDARLLLVGARPARRIRALARADVVEVHGDVPSMTPFYGAAWVVAAPLRYGTGLQTKVLEAFAHGRAVVTTTSVAARVPGVAAGEHLEAADDAHSLAVLISQVLKDGSRRTRLATAGNAIASSLSWDRCSQMLEATYQR